MTDRPIIFSAPMILALLAMRKTMTRRLAWQSPRVAIQVGDGPFEPVMVPSAWQRVKLGDRLWVRESIYGHPHPSHGNDGVSHLADGEWIETCAAVTREQWETLYNYRGKRAPFTGRGNSVPSIHMPRWASRLTLIVTGTKIERLQDISEADAIAEGWQRKLGGEYLPGEVHYDAARDWYSDLWGDLHGVESWRANPEVVALSFRVEKINIDQLPQVAA